MSDKERLEDIKQRHSALSPLPFGGQSVKNTDLHWLIKQAERVQEVEGAFEKLLKETAKVDGQYATLHREWREQTKENARLREALEYYAHPDTYEPVTAHVGLDSEAEDIYPIDGDKGEEARRALKGETE